MESVGIVTASALLGICRQRIQQLIYANRVRGAYKTKKGWQIPLYKGMPQIIPAKRGCKGTWRIREGGMQMIHVNSKLIQKNNKKAPQDPYAPVLIVRQGSRKIYGHELAFEGKCRIVYDPRGSKKCKGVKVWIEVPPTSKVTVINWNKTGYFPPVNPPCPPKGESDALSLSKCYTLELEEVSEILNVLTGFA